MCPSQLSLDWIMEALNFTSREQHRAILFALSSDHFRPWHQRTRDFSGAAGRSLCHRCRRHCAAPSGLGDKGDTGDKRSYTLLQIKLNYAMLSGYKKHVSWYLQRTAWVSVWNFRVKVTWAVPGRSSNRWAGQVETGEVVIITTLWQHIQLFASTLSPLPNLFFFPTALPSAVVCNTGVSDCGPRTSSMNHSIKPSNYNQAPANPPEWRFSGMRYSSWHGCPKKKSKMRGLPRICGHTFLKTCWADQ